MVLEPGLSRTLKTLNFYIFEGSLGKPKGGIPWKGWAILEPYKDSLRLPCAFDKDMEGNVMTLTPVFLGQVAPSN